MKVVCKACNKTVPEGICCDSCGALLDCGESVSTSPTLEKIPVDRLRNNESLPIANPRSSVVEDQEAKTPEPVVQRFISEEIELTYDITEFSVVGLEHAFSFTICAGSKKLSNVCVYAEHQSAGGNRIAGKSKELWRLPPGQERKVSIAYRSAHPGVAVYNFYVVYRCDDELCCMESDERRVPVYPPDMGARDAIQNLSINIKNEISNVTGHANDYQINNALGELHDLMNRVDPEDDIKSVIKQIAECGSYVALELYESNWRPVGAEKTPSAEISVPETLYGTPPESGRGLLTLRCGGRVIHLFNADGGFDIGRSRDNQVVTRHIESDGNAKVEGNKKISRHHCRMEQIGDNLQILDSSVWGNWVNGVKVLKSSEVKLSSFVLALAGSSEQDPAAFVLKCRLWTCGNDLQRECRLSACSRKRAISSIILHRADNHKESHVGLWHCCDMRSVDAQLAGLIIWRQDGGFGYATAQDSGWLKPGMSFTVGGALVEVLPHSPLGVDG